MERKNLNELSRKTFRAVKFNFNHKNAAKPVAEDYYYKKCKKRKMAKESRKRNRRRKK